jgi:hypothetical protein
VTADTDNKKKKSEWLIMIYLAGDNNLSASSIALLQELEAADRNRNVRVLAAFDSATPIPQGARYVEIRRSRDEPSAFSKRMNWPLHNDLLTPGHIVVTPDFCKPLGTPHNPTQDTVATALGRFLEFAREHYRAKRYMLILFGHGLLVAGNTFLADTQPPSFLKLDDFANILRNHFGRKIDILGFDNCVMNGIETAVQLHGQVDFTIGSQGLMLANGWPFRKIVEVVGEYPYLDSQWLAEAILRVCARNLLDFTFMERSSEQAICDVTKFGRTGPIVAAMKELTKALRCGLKLKPDGRVGFPIVRDVVRLARLEAQNYFGEVFVDLYDFCELLIRKCNEVIDNLSSLASVVTTRKESFKTVLLQWPDLQQLQNIATKAWRVLEVFRTQGIVPKAYYVGPQVQYSHGVSVFFPWSLPEGPITFEPVEGSGADPNEFDFKTPFEIYSKYLFAEEHYGDWSRFLDAFYRATLRDIRRVEFEYNEAAIDVDLFFEDKAIGGERVVPAVDLQKTSSDTGEDDCNCTTVKNYPRRFYVSPADCLRLMPVFGLPGKPDPNDENIIFSPGDKKVSYLGWNIRGLVAEVIGLPQDSADDCPEQPYLDDVPEPGNTY